MGEGPYAIFRLIKHKAPVISKMEAHHERLKKNYASNPNIDPERTPQNFHLVQPSGRYRAIANRQIQEAGCRTRKDSVLMMEALVTASPEYLAGKSERELRRYFERAVEFMKTRQDPSTYVSAVVHMDEANPHMHLLFVPLTQDKRLSAKEIAGDRKKMVRWQDEFWSYMVKEYPALQRGESALSTGRTHIPTQLFKQAAHLTKQKEKLQQLLEEITPLNAKAKSREIAALLDTYIPGVENLITKLKKSSKAGKELRAEIAELKKEVNSSKASTLRQLELEKQVQKLDDLQQTVKSLKKTVDAIPEEILAAYRQINSTEKGGHNRE